MHEISSQSDRWTGDVVFLSAVTCDSHSIIGSVQCNRGACAPEAAATSIRVTAAKGHVMRGQRLVSRLRNRRLEELRAVGRSSSD